MSVNKAYIIGSFSGCCLGAIHTGKGIDTDSTFSPQYTRRFSLGNGPDEWVKEYLINRESGKMLGTLVALALARMPQLDTFVWDMPTGILRDCWSALSLVREGQGNPRCTPSCLQKVWVRFHDNREILDGPDGLPTASQGTQLSPGHTPGPSQTQSSQSPTPLEWSYRHIEHPSFSVLPPLRSLNVLNVDEIAYLEEMSVLIKRSLGSLRELRVGLASTVAQKGFASARDLNVPIGDDEPTEYQQVLRRLLGKLAKGEDEDHGSATGYDVLTTPVAPIAGEHHVSGSKNLLIQPGPAAPSNIVTSKNRSNNPALLSGIAPKAASGGLTTSDPAGILVDLVIQTNHGPISGRSTTSELVAPLLSSPGEDGPYDPDAVAPNAPTETARSTARSDQVGTTGVPDASKSSTSLIADSSEREADEKRLKLQTLELEYVDLDAGVLLTAVDWTVLTTLTLLNCDSQERLWKMLRRAFTPRPSTSQPMLRRKSKMHLRDLSSLDSLATPRSEYRINLRRIHTNCVSSALMAFLKETLAPNSLEWLFLQDGAIISHPTEPGSISKYDSNVSVEAICRGPLRRHRLSLKKLLIDSDNRLIDRQRRTPKWRKWVLDRDALSFLTGGKMSALREVSIAMDYRDWVSM